MEENVLKQQIEEILRSNGEGWELYDPEKAINEINALFESKLKAVERENVVLYSDIAQSIGYAQGLGHPNTYLEKRYPELSQQKETDK